MDESAQLKHLREMLASIGMALPKTRAGYADMLKKIDLTTPTGQKTYGVMIGSAGAADDYYTKREQGIAVDWREQWKLKESLTIEEAISLFFERDPSAIGQEKPEGWKNAYAILAKAIKSDFQKYHEIGKVVHQLDADLEAVLMPTMRAKQTESKNQDITAVLEGMAGSMMDATGDVSRVAEETKRISNEVAIQVALISALAFTPDTVKGYQLEKGEYVDLEKIDVTIKATAIRKWVPSSVMHSSSFFPALSQDRTSRETQKPSFEQQEKAGVVEAKIKQPRLPDWRPPESVKSSEKEKDALLLVSDLFVNAKNSPQYNDVSECVKSFIEKNKKSPSGHVELFAHMKTLYPVKNQAVMLPSGGMDKENLRRNYKRWTTPSDQK